MLDYYQAMKTLRLAVTESDRPVIMFMYDDDAPFEVFHLGNIRESIFQLAATLSSVIQGVRCGLALPEMNVQFSHRGGPECLAFHLEQTVAGSNARVELREFPATNGWGGLGDKEESKLVHETTLSPKQLSDTLHGFLEELAHSGLLGIYKNDKPLLVDILNALCLYDADGTDSTVPAGSGFSVKGG